MGGFTTSDGPFNLNCLDIPDPRVPSIPAGPDSWATILDTSLRGWLSWALMGRPWGCSVHASLPLLIYRVLFVFRNLGLSLGNLSWEIPKAMTSQYWLSRAPIALRISPGLNGCLPPIGKWPELRERVSPQESEGKPLVHPSIHSFIQNTIIEPGLRCPIGQGSPSSGEQDKIHWSK